MATTKDTPSDDSLWTEDKPAQLPGQLVRYDQAQGEAGEGEAGAKLPFNQHAKTLGATPGELAAVRVLRQWPQGKEVTEDEFRRALDEFRGAKVG